MLKRFEKFFIAVLIIGVCLESPFSEAKSKNVTFRGNYDRRSHRTKECYRSGCTLMRAQKSTGIFYRSQKGKNFVQERGDGSREVSLPEASLVFDQNGAIDFLASQRRHIRRWALKKLPQGQEPVFDASTKRWLIPDADGRRNPVYVDYSQTAATEGLSIRSLDSQKSAGELASPTSFTRDSTANTGSGSSELKGAEGSSAIQTPAVGSAVSDGVTVDECPMSKQWFQSIADAKGSEFCWSGLSDQQKVDKIIQYVLEINRLRPEFYVDPRFGVCVARFESSFIPNIQTPDPGSTAAGLFQVTRTTHLGVDNSIGKSRIPEFADLSTGDYRRQMIRSPLAQTDIFSRVAQEKFNIAKRLGKLPQTADPRAVNTDVNYWKTIATYYYGHPDPAETDRYVRKIASCQSCLGSLISENGEQKPESGFRLQQCLSGTVPAYAFLEALFRGR